MGNLDGKVNCAQYIRHILSSLFGPAYVWICSRSFIRNRLAPHLASAPYQFLYSYRGTGLGVDDELRRLKRCCRLRGGRILVIGVQKGDELHKWIGTGVQEIVAIDVEAFPEDWKKVSVTLSIRGIKTRFLVMDAQALAFRQAAFFDLVYSQSVLEHVVDVDSFVSRSCACLKPGGTYFAYFGPLWRSYGGSTHLGMLGYDHLMIPWQEYLRYAKLVGDGWQYWAERGMFCQLSWDEIRRIIEQYFRIERIALLEGKDSRWYRRTYPEKWKRLLESYSESDLHFRLGSVTARRRLNVGVPAEELRANNP